jgi:hypothetical protein
LLCLTCLLLKLDLSRVFSVANIQAATDKITFSYQAVHILGIAHALALP